jgi:DNA-binding MarR family transcriptional regulator
MAVEYIKSREGRSLSNSAYKILEIIEEKGSINASDLTNELTVSTRTIHYSLKRLLEKSIIEKRPYLLDMRQTRYSLNKDILEQIVRTRV